MLISPDMPWPPPGAEKLRKRWPSWAAWWSGDLDDLRTHASTTAPGGYWEKHRDKELKDRQMHLPLAGDIAGTSAELVFSDSPTLQFSADVQDAWDELAQTIGWGNSLVEAGEVCAALGGVYLRPAWERDLFDHPLSTSVRADEAIPEFRFGMLIGVVFVTNLGERDGFQWRWLEHHEPGQIRHELWKGTPNNIGKLMGLADHPDTKHLAVGESGGVIDTRPIRARGILVEYIPNQLPQPLDRQPYGRADIQGLETELDALDAAWASWMRDLDLGKGRVLVSAEMLDSVAPSSRSTGHVQTATDKFFGRHRRSTPAKVFDEDAKVFTPLSGLPMESGNGLAPITPVQFAIRVQEHADTCAALVEQIVSRAGYAPQSFGMHVEGQLSGTAIRRREHRSHQTKNRKRQYARPALERFAETLMLINAVIFGRPRPTERPTLEWRETDQADPKETAETINTLKLAEAISIETSVQMAHPEWDEKQVTDEVERIQAEREAKRAENPLTGYETPDALDTAEP
ncbi:phage portal protein [Prauserella endophytica]|uniref:Phage portal protein n=1 Tax=Prauserella endophytica TaxID=1592324 RepID=A0ABY2RZY2_9PSEU|nr:phage portal protein [Prauserella endophytica]PXY20515.1 hypothetical protein BAY59_31305 [Prauserella coralliicola]TKG66930.1 phage portal protein [Prauserella endophytica]